MAREIFLIVARARDGSIGDKGALPWRLPADLKRFKALTMGKPMIMGARHSPRCRGCCRGGGISC